MLALCEHAHLLCGRIQQLHIVSVAPSGYAVIRLQYLVHLCIIPWTFGVLVYQQQFVLCGPFSPQPLGICKERSALAGGRVGVFVCGLTLAVLAPCDVAVALGSPLDEVGGYILVAGLEVQYAFAALLFSSLLGDTCAVLHEASACAQAGASGPQAILVVLKGVEPLSLGIQRQVLLLAGLHAHGQRVGLARLLQQLHHHIMPAGQHLSLVAVAIFLSIDEGLVPGCAGDAQPALGKHAVLHLETCQAHAALLAGGHYAVGHALALEPLVELHGRIHHQILLLKGFAPDVGAVRADGSVHAIGTCDTQAVNVQVGGLHRNASGCQQGCEQGVLNFLIHSLFLLRS